MSAEQPEKQAQEVAQEAQGEAQASESGHQEQQKSGSSWYSKPGNLGNTAGDKINDTLSSVGEPVGKGLETVAKPVGGIVDPLVGGVMRAGKGFQDQYNAEGGFGSAAKGPHGTETGVDENLKKPTGGKDQTAQNPLGLGEE